MPRVFAVLRFMTSSILVGHTDRKLRRFRSLENLALA